MKKVVFGGLIFIGGAIMYSVATLGIANVSVQVQYMLMPKYFGIVAMIGGLVLGFWGIKKKD